jgi:hypothetical protein
MPPTRHKQEISTERALPRDLSIWVLSIGYAMERRGIEIRRMQSMPLKAPQTIGDNTVSEIMH